MPTTTSQDPFTVAHAHLWSILEAHTPFTAMVRAENRIKWTGDIRHPIKPMAGPSDSPQVMILAAGGKVPDSYVSGSMRARKRFRVLIATDEKRFDQVGTEGVGSSNWPVEWECIRAFSALLDTTVSLTWGAAANAFSVRFSATEQQSRLGDPESRESIPGWATIWEMDALFSFTQSSIAPVTA